MYVSYVWVVLCTHAGKSAVAKKVDDSGAEEAEESKGDVTDVAADSKPDASGDPAASDVSTGIPAVAGMLEPVKAIASGSDGDAAGAEDGAKDASSMLQRRRLCENHDDNVTQASWACMDCIDLRAPDAAPIILPEGIINITHYSSNVILRLHSEVWLPMLSMSCITSRRCCAFRLCANMVCMCEFIQELNAPAHSIPFTSNVHACVCIYAYIVTTASHCTSSRR